MTNWKKLIMQEMLNQGETWVDVVEHYPEDAAIFNQEFDSDFGREQGAPFTLWTLNRVYFPVCYDGAEWAGSVPRNPCAEATTHLGGG